MSILTVFVGFLGVPETRGKERSPPCGPLMCVFRARKAIDSRQAGPWFRAMSVHAREAGRVGLSIKDDHSSMNGFFDLAKVPTAYRAAGAAIEAEPLGWIPPFFGVFARRDLSLRIDSPDKSSW